MLVVLERLLGRDQQPDRREKLGVSFDLGATAELYSDSTGSTDAALVLRGARGAGSRGLEIQWRIQITARQASPRPLKCVVSRARGRRNVYL